MGLDIYWYKTNKKDGYFRRFVDKCYELDAYDEFLWKKHKGDYVDEFNNPKYTRQEQAIVDAMTKELEELRVLCDKDELNNDLFPNRKAHAIAQWIIGKNKDRQEIRHGLICPKYTASYLSTDDIHELVQKLNRICDAKMLQQAVDKEFPVIEGMIFADRAIDYVTTKEDWKSWRNSFSNLYEEMTEDEEIAVEFSW